MFELRFPPAVKLATEAKQAEQSMLRRKALGLSETATNDKGLARDGKNDFSRRQKALGLPATATADEGSHLACLTRGWCIVEGRLRSGAPPLRPNALPRWTTIDDAISHDATSHDACGRHPDLKCPCPNVDPQVLAGTPLRFKRSALFRLRC